jgi:hypothetical protein
MSGRYQRRSTAQWISRSSACFDPRATCRGALPPAGTITEAGSSAGSRVGGHRPRRAQSLSRRRCGGSRSSLTQIVVLTVPVRVLSTPAAEYEVTAKYQVPDVRFVTV